MKNKRLILILLLIYFIINVAFLTIFPFVHSDEAWLSGLTRNMIETKNIACTEPFFNLYPRNAHAIKIVFHLLQMLFIKTIGYNIFSVRLISLIFSIVCLYIFYELILLFTNKKIISLLFTLFLGLDIQYIYASHFARQEIILVFITLLGLRHYINPFFNRINPHILLGIIIGISIGIHPNSFLIALIFGFLYLYDIIIKQKKWINLIYLITTISIFATFFIIISFIMNPNFISDYIKYGSTLGVSNSFLDKILNVKNYYLKLYYSISGTYYTPNIKFQLISFPLILIIGFIYHTIINKNSMIIRIILIIVALNTGLIIIGRYNVTSIIFIFPFFYILLAILMTKCIPKINYNIAILSVLCLLSLTSDIKQITPYLQYNYNDYLQSLKVLSPNDHVLANLNCEYYFNNGHLFDYRNLTYLKKNQLTFEEYIKKNDINYIIYPKEMDYIHRNPKWNILYGDDSYYYDDMKHFLKNNCTLIKKFNNPMYGIRIVRYILKGTWNISIYKIK